jgi:hypothetical protein
VVIPNAVSIGQRPGARVRLVSWWHPESVSSCKLVKQLSPSGRLVSCWHPESLSSCKLVKQLSPSGRLVSCNPFRPIFHQVDPKVSCRIHQENMCVVVKESETHGYGLFATKGFAVGEVVLSEEPSCRVRSDVQYDAELYTPAWKLTYEAAQCPSVREQCLSGKLQPLAFKALQWDDRDTTALEYLSGKPSLQLPRNSAFRLYCVVCAVNIHRPDGIMFMYDLANYVNHSCAPTARVSLGGDTLSLTALRPITAGEELTFCYVGSGTYIEEGQQLEQDINMIDPTVLQEMVRLHYGFTCKCSAHQVQ